MNSRCGSTMVTFCLPLSTSPFVSHRLSNRLTVCSVVPVISARSCRDSGNAISTPRAVRRPACCDSRSNVCAMRRSTFSVASSRSRSWRS
jgi:hypothetical protein